MLNFFRKFQKILFIFITVIIIISFSFFGAISSFNDNSQEVPDQVIGKGVDGSPMMRGDVLSLCRLITTSPLDRQGLQRGQVPNFLNDSVIQKDLMSTGLAMILARQYFEDLKPDLEKRLPRLKNFRPYVHPHAKDLSAERIWERYSPNINYHLAILKNKTDQFTLETLAVLFELYLDQSMVPADVLAQVLTHQQNQLGAKLDPILAQGDLSLFGFHSLEDWFGPRFVELAGQFILNTALIAKENGYTVSQTEVRADLFQNIQDGYTQVAREAVLNPQEIESYYRKEIQDLRLDEQTVLNNWRQVMLFRRVFNDVGNSVFIDSLALDQFHSFTKEGMNIELYELPAHLQLKDLRSLFKLQMYLDAVSQVHNSLKIPFQVGSLEQIEKRAPSLVSRQFELEYVQVSREALFGEISLKQTWEWEADVKNWALLQKQFPDLLKGQVNLDKLVPKQRLTIDQFARSKILDAHPEKIGAALQKERVQTATAGLRTRGGTFPFGEIEDSAELMYLLEKAPIKGESATLEQQSIQDQLNLYTSNGKTFYRIAVLKRDPHKIVLTAQEALKDGTLDQMLDLRLEAAYPEIRKKHTAAFQAVDGSFKPFVLVKDEVARYVYAPLLKAIEESYRTQIGELASKTEALTNAFYTQHRFLLFMQEGKQDIENNRENSKWLRQEGTPENPLVGQWKLSKKTCSVKRNADLPFAKEKMFTLGSNEWSDVEVGFGGSLSFYRVLNKVATERGSLADVTRSHNALALDARRSLMVDLLKKIRDKGAIELKYCSEEQ